MKTKSNHLRILCAIVLAVSFCVARLSRTVPGQSLKETEGARLLDGAIDMHFHMDRPLANGPHDEDTIATIRVARSDHEMDIMFKQNPARLVGLPTK